MARAAATLRGGVPAPHSLHAAGAAAAKAAAPAVATKKKKGARRSERLEDGPKTSWLTRRARDRRRRPRARDRPHGPGGCHRRQHPKGASVSRRRRWLCLCWGRCKLTRAVERVRQGRDDPKLPGYDACPAWLSGLADTRPTLSELQRRNADGESGAAQQLSVAEGLRLLRMQRRAEIKAANASSGQE